MDLYVHPMGAQAKGRPQSSFLSLSSRQTSTHLDGQEK